jgi:O-antigen ligase
MNIKRARSTFDMEKERYYVFMFIAAIITGIAISCGFLSAVQTALLAGIAFTLFFVFDKPHLVLYVALPLMFIPLSLGTLFHLRITWAAEPLILILFLMIVLKNMQTSERAFVLSWQNPFLLLLFLYVIVLFGNYVRHPLPASSALGMAEEMGGIRFYYEKILIFTFSLSVGYLAETSASFRQKFINLMLAMASVVTIIGLAIVIWDALYNFIENLIVANVFNNASLLTGLWTKTVDPFTGALRNSVLWVTPFGILLLLADVTSISKPARIVLFVLFVAGIVLSATRNFFFGILCALLVWAILTHNKKMIIVLVAVGVVGFLLPGIGLVTKQFRRILYFPADLERLTSFRYELFKIYWKFFMQHPFFGVGVGATEIEQVPVASPEYFLQQNLRFGGHGFFLGTLYTQGIIGLVPFFLLYILTFRIGFVLFKHGHDSSTKVLGLLAIMFVAYSFVPFLVGGQETYNQFFVIMGLVSGTYGYYKRTAAKNA